MRIALLSDKYAPDPGGLAISTARLARGLISAGHQVAVCVVSPVIEAGEIVEALVEGVLVVRVGLEAHPADALAAWFDALIALHQRQPFDLIHAYYAVDAGFVGVYAARFLGIPAVVSVRGNDLDRAVFDPSQAAHTLFALQQASAVTAVTSELAGKAAALAPGQRVIPVFNSVDADFFQPGSPDPALTALHQPNGEMVIGFVGEARVKKGIGVLLPAFAQIAAQRPVKLLLIGGVRKDAQALVRLFRAQHRTLSFESIPYVDQVQLPAYYHLLDVLVLPSLHDGMPNSLLEGMACGCAVVASAAGGMPDVIVHQETGLLVPAGEVAALVDAIRHALDHPEQARAMGQRAREQVRQQFTPQRELSANLDLYHALLSDV